MVVYTGRSVADSVHDTLSSVETFLGIISGISLVVAGVGILNIMLVSMMERTREIGIIKSLGAKDRTVLFAFLSECAFIGMLGSIIGIGAGYVAQIGLGSLLGTWSNV